MRTITGLFNSRPEAERAVETLVQQLGVARDKVQVLATGAENATAGTDEQRSESHHGFRTAGGAVPGIMVSLLVPDEQAAAVRDALLANGGQTDGPDPSA